MPSKFEKALPKHCMSKEYCISVAWHSEMAVQAQRSARAFLYYWMLTRHVVSPSTFECSCLQN